MCGPCAPVNTATSLYYSPSFSVSERRPGNEAGGPGLLLAYYGCLSIKGRSLAPDSSPRRRGGFDVGPRGRSGYCPGPLKGHVPLE